jgi:osmotically-inducible protein OsmY
VSSLRSFLSLWLALSLPVFLGGCVGLVIGGAVAGSAAGGYVAGQERGVTGQFDDIRTKTNVELALAAMKPPLPGGIDVGVYEGRTLLTGTAATPEAKAAAGEAARRVAGVRALYNEIEVRAPETVWDGAKDAWITTELRSRLAFDKEIRSLNYAIETVYGSVYLLGSARTKGELDRATAWARNIPGVRRVVSFVEIRPGAALAQVAPPPASGEAWRTPGSAYPAPAAPAPVEVHRLSSSR